jgi:hypothetical protein
VVSGVYQNNPLPDEAVGKRIHDYADADFPLWKSGIEGDFFE